jgi:hypothetical protein
LLIFLHPFSHNDLPMDKWDLPENIDPLALENKDQKYLAYRKVCVVDLVHIQIKVIKIKKRSSLVPLSRQSEDPPEKPTQ